MDARSKAGLRFLVINCLLLFGAVMCPAQQRSPRGALYVLPHAGNCTETVLALELDGISPLPTNVLLRIKRRDDGSGEDKEVIARKLSLTDGAYRWSGLLAPLGKHKAQLYDAGDSTKLLGEFTFNNIDILKHFIDRERGEITYISRGGRDPANSDPHADPDRNSLTVDRLPKPKDDNKIHIIVMNRRGEKADEYYGPPNPNQTWKSSPLRLGEYRLIVAEYYKNGECTVIRGR